MLEENPTREFTTYSKDTPVGHPSFGGRAGIFIPTESFDLDASTTIRKSAGVVGFGNVDGSLTVYFEANRFDESGLHKWEHKVRKAYDRLIATAPTVSKAKMNASTLELIGFIDGMGIRISLPERLTHWLTLSHALDTAPESDVIPFGRK